MLEDMKVDALNINYITGLENKQIKKKAIGGVFCVLDLIEIASQ